MRPDRSDEHDEERLQRLFDDTAPALSDERLHRMLARAAEVPSSARGPVSRLVRLVRLSGWAAAAAGTALAAFTVWMLVTPPGDTPPAIPSAIPAAVAGAAAPGQVDHSDDDLFAELDDADSTSLSDPFAGLALAMDTDGDLLPELEPGVDAAGADEQAWLQVYDALLDQDN
jgi:hypothetical protein